MRLALITEILISSQLISCGSSSEKETTEIIVDDSIPSSIVWNDAKFTITQFSGSDNCSVRGTVRKSLWG